VVGATPETTNIVSTKYAIMRNCGFVVANAIRIGYPQPRGLIMTTRRTMKKLWNRLFKKNSKSKNPTIPKLPKTLIHSIERDDRGRWVIPKEEKKSSKNFTAQLDKFKGDLNKATPKKKDTNE
jgi:hypothetical protein